MPPTKMTSDLTEREARAIELLSTVAKGSMVRVWTRGVCLPASRISCEFLRSVGIPANPVAVDMVYENDAFRERVAAEGEPDMDTLMRWRAEGVIRGGIVYHAREIYPDQEFDPDGWDGGHCVVTFKSASGKRYLLDLTADQSNLPEHGLIFDVICCPIPEDWIEGKGGAVIEQSSQHGTIRMTYIAHPEDQSHLETQAWQCYDDPFNMARSLVMTLRARMEED